MPKFTDKVKEKLGDTLKGTCWQVWSHNRWKECPILYRDQLVGKLDGDFKELLKEMNGRRSRNPSADICLYSEKPRGLALVEIDEKTANISTMVKFWFYVQNGGSFKLMLNGEGGPTFEPAETRVIHFVPRDDPPYWRMLSLFLEGKIKEATQLKYELKADVYEKNQVYEKNGGKRPNTSTVRKVARKVVEILTS